ncbi:MAG: hypothetical protein HYS08_10725 [Chlamydiae bacterium]|nr:hypothetical protein [Chlamydiota bacterium]MBI3266598.1 hypothetical protein [Chlamydiota bacterium]
MKKILGGNETGLSLLAVVLTLLILAVMGTVIISQFGSGVTTTLNEQTVAQAAFVTEGGEEVALRYLIDNARFGENGVSPQTSSFTDTSFGRGSFAVSSLYPLTAIANTSTAFINSAATTVTVNSTSSFPSSGRLKIDLETMTYAGKTATTFTGLTRGTDATVATDHYQRSHVFIATVLTADPGVAGTTLNVASTSGFLTSGTLRIGEELMDYAGITSTTFTGLTRGTHGTTAALHGMGQTVWPGLQQCEVTSTGTVGTSGQMGYGVRVFRQTVSSVVSPTLPALISTSAGTGVGGFSGDGGAATAARVSNPRGMEIDKQGQILYIADTTNDRIRQVNLTTGIITTVAGTGVAGNTGDGGAAIAARLRAPQDVTLNADGSILYITDTGNNRIRQVNLTTGIITNFAGNSGGASGNTGDGLSATGVLARLNTPRGIDVDPIGNVYIADTNNNRIRRVTSGGTLQAVAGDAVLATAGNIPSAGGAPVAVAAARFRRPEGVAVGINDALIYLADTQTGAPGSDPGKVRLINLTTNLVSNIAGIDSTGFSGDGAAATLARLSNPAGVDADAQGNVYIADTGNNRIRKVTTTTGIINTIAGDGTTPFDGDNQDARNAALNAPRGIVLDEKAGMGPVTGTAGLSLNYSQDYYIADTAHDRIRKVTQVENLEEVDWREVFQ